MVILSFKYRIYPSKKQEKELFKMLYYCCWLYNHLLEKKATVYREKWITLTQFDLNKLVTEIKIPVHSQVKQNVSKRIQEAFNHFLRRVKKGDGKFGFPKFKDVKDYRSITYPQSGFKILSTKKISLSKVGSFPIILHRIPKGKIKTLTIKQINMGWYTIFTCEDVPVERSIKFKEAFIGIDVGIEHFATLSKGKFIQNPQFLNKAERRLTFFFIFLSRKKKGSDNWKKARRKVAKVYEMISSQRRDFLHKLSSELTEQFRFIAIERLAISRMARNRYHARSIYSASWGAFMQMLEYKAKRDGGQVVKVDPKNTSKVCSKCGSKQEMPLSQREFLCKKCGLKVHRDINASRNIHTAGQAEVYARGDTVRPLLKARVCEAGTTRSELVQAKDAEKTLFIDKEDVT